MTAIDPAIAAFGAEARRYCAWALDAHGGNEGAVEALRRLVSLYQAALVLPSTGDGCSEEPPKIDFAEERNRVLAACSRLPMQYYGEQFDPLVVPPTEEATVGDLFDDISDVFADVRYGLWLFEQGHTPDALWEWTFGFRTHWGRHATAAIRVLHAYLSQSGFSFNDAESAPKA